MKNVELVAQLLKQRYLDFPHYNKRNPLDELLFILCSVTTTEPVYLRTYRALKRAFPRHSDLAKASVTKIAKVIFEGGQYYQKAVAIKTIIQMLSKQFGRPTLAPLRKMPNAECERFLTALPRVGKKVARCVMMYSLGRHVFPVDTHCRRIAQRIGWAPQKRFNEDILQEAIPTHLRFSLHVNLISFGREFCRAVPLCEKCPLSKYCLRVGV